MVTAQSHQTSWYCKMEFQPNRQERRIKQRRKLRMGIKFPLTDDRGCIVLFDRSCIADRRLKSLLSRETATKAEPGNLSFATLNAEDLIDLLTPPLIFDGARDFSIAGKLIASVNNIYDSQSSGRWKELELYQTPKGKYVCLEIWRTTMTGEHDQHWLTTCDDLESVQELLGNSSLASELFDNLP